MSKVHFSADQLPSADSVLILLQGIERRLKFNPKAVKARFLEIANLILEWLQSPRIECWWMDLLAPTINLEQCIRTLRLPDWLAPSEVVFQILEKFEGYEAAFDGRRSLDSRWEPGRMFNPACFRIELEGTDGSVDSVKFSFCDPYRFMEFDDQYQRHSGHPAFVFVTRSLQVADDEIAARKPVFDDIRSDAIFILKSWIRYVDSRPEFTDDEIPVPFTNPCDTLEQIDTWNGIPRVFDDVTESTVADSVPCVYENLPKKFLRQELGKLRKSSPVDGKTLIPALKGLGVRLHPDFDISSAAFDLPVDVNSLGKFTSINDPKSRATLLEAWLQSSDNRKRRSKSKLGTKLGES